MDTYALQAGPGICRSNRESRSGKPDRHPVDGLFLTVLLCAAMVHSQIIANTGIGPAASKPAVTAETWLRPLVPPPPPLLELEDLHDLELPEE